MSGAASKVGTYDTLTSEDGRSCRVYILEDTAEIMRVQIVGTEDVLVLKKPSPGERPDPASSDAAKRDTPRA